MKKKGGWLSHFIEFESGGSDSEEEVPDITPEDLDSSDIDALLARTRAMTAEAGVPEPEPMASPTPTPEAPPPMPSNTDASIVEGRPFEDIYAESGIVPPSPKSVEEIILFLDGLAKMTPEVQEAALAAADHSDKSWAIVDVVLDAKNKIKACEQYKASLGDKVTAASAQATEAVNAQDELIAKAHETIDAEIANHEAQIAQLRELRAQETSAAEAAKEAARTSLKTTTEACGREAARVDSHIGRLRHFIKSFGPKAQEKAS